jgi:hypothetical protein
MPVTVDFVAKGESDEVWQMILVEEGPWVTPYEQELRRLQDRLYGCVDAAIDGQLAAQFPQTKGRRIRIRVDGYSLPRQETRSFFDTFSKEVLRIPEYESALSKSDYVSGIEFELRLEDIR